MGAVDTTWDADSGTVKTAFVSKYALTLSENVKTPVGSLARGTSDFERYHLGDPESRARFSVLTDLHAKGYTEYFLLKQTYGRNFEWLNFAPDAEGVYASFATKQTQGFSEAQIESIRAIWQPFALFLKATTERILSEKLLEAYVGNLPAQNILSGMVEHGDGESISCALWYSDLRGSTRLSATLPSGKYLELLNHYFECTAGAVSAHGGEVLKLIGDGVMAIFPFQGGNEAAVCASALAAAEDALRRAGEIQERETDSATELYFGIGLHVGEVILGNVGTANRLDMTVTGHSANQVTRIEALTKPLGLSVLASPTFFQTQSEGLTSVGRYPVPDFGGMTEIYSLVERA
ncbi:adenylate/guanylate cyclase domain-containing protein [Roseibium sp. MMSF_3544]|uniref:adenylate/guanylate cyclase domain-containing protein n=1 Tax=unclassified Roseibium TaxID=2629323 RepID=UPI00273F4588|nr:adenylate/guanylate cyclase domain-containing protein [Roseibium sp. MMSF_3544]